jgi:hypothetical protein
MALAAKGGSIMLIKFLNALLTGDALDIKLPYQAGVGVRDQTQAWRL